MQIEIPDNIMLDLITLERLTDFYELIFEYAEDDNDAKLLEALRVVIPEFKDRLEDIKGV